MPTITPKLGVVVVMRTLKLNILLLICALVLVPLTSHAQSGNKAYDIMLHGMYSNTVPLILADTLNTSNYILLDTREFREFEVSHIPGARWVGYDTFNYRSVTELPKDTAIIVYCSVGYRSERIGERLKEMGYTNVKNLYGGVFQWVNEDKPIVNMDEQRTEQVHAYSKTWGIWLNKGKKVYK